MVQTIIVHAWVLLTSSVSLGCLAMTACTARGAEDPPTAAAADGSNKPARCNIVFMLADNVGWAVARDGMVYQPGYDWYRIDPKNMTACCLAKDGPPAGWLQSIADSLTGVVWWGAVGAKEFGTFRVVVDKER